MYMYLRAMQRERRLAHGGRRVAQKTVVVAGKRVFYYHGTVSTVRNNSEKVSKMQSKRARKENGSTIVACRTNVNFILAATCNCNNTY